MKNLKKNNLRKQQIHLRHCILGSNSSYRYKTSKISKISDINKIDTIQRQVVNSLDGYTEEMKINFNKIYNLFDGKYYLLIFCSDFNIRIYFIITNGNVDYKEPYINKHMEPTTDYFYLTKD